MPIIGSLAGGSASGFGQRKCGKPYSLSYFVLAGGGGAGVGHFAGGGGGGGFRILNCKTYKVTTGKSYTILLERAVEVQIIMVQILMNLVFLQQKVEILFLIQSLLQVVETEIIIQEVQAQVAVLQVQEEREMSLQ